MTEQRSIDIPQSDYPFTVELWRKEDDRRGPATWKAVIPGPCALTVPGFGPGTWTRVTFPNRVEVKSPPGEQDKDF